MDTATTSPTTDPATDSPSDKAAASSDALAVVKAVYAAFGAKDMAQFLPLLDDDIVITQSDQLPWGGTHHGREGVLTFFGTLMSHIETRVQVERYVVAGDTVVEVGKTSGRAIASGRHFVIDEVHVWTVRDGRIAGMHAIVDDAAMLAALQA